MANIPIETVATVISIVFLSITQVILILKGRTNEAKQIEIKKEKQINKLTAKRNKFLKKAVKNENKIKEIKGKNEESNTSI